MLQEYFSSDEESNHCSGDNVEEVGEDTCPKPSVSQTFQQTITNLTYNLKHSNLLAIPLLQRKPINIRDDNSRAHLLGTSYDYKTQEDLVARFQETIWLTYRDGIEEIGGDNGWGCMIRVIQMMLAEVMKRHLQQSSAQIVELFKQGSDSPFSLLNICKEGSIKNRWTGLIEIMSIVKQLLKKQEQHPLCLDIYSGGISIPDMNTFEKGSESPLKMKTGKVVIIENRFPGNCIPEQLQAHFYHLMDHQSFCGVTGGLAGQALFVLGHYEDNLICLDPHYVQKADQNNYFKTTPRGISINKLCPSFAFCYYFNNETEYMDWISWLIRADQIYSGQTVFSVEVNNREQWAHKNRKISDQDFQMLSY